VPLGLVSIRLTITWSVGVCEDACWTVRGSRQSPGQGQKRNVRRLYFLEICFTAEFVSDVGTCQRTKCACRGDLTDGWPWILRIRICLAPKLTFVASWKWKLMWWQTRCCTAHVCDAEVLGVLKVLSDCRVLEPQDGYTCKVMWFKFDTCLT
jgi:hypothetical protein